MFILKEFLALGRNLLFEGEQLAKGRKMVIHSTQGSFINTHAMKIKVSLSGWECYGSLIDLFEEAGEHF